MPIDECLKLQWRILSLSHIHGGHRQLLHEKMLMELENGFHKMMPIKAIKTKCMISADNFGRIIKRWQNRIG